MNFAKFLQALGLKQPDAVVDAVVRESSHRDGTLNRRAFLRLAGAGAAGLVVAPSIDLDALLWTPRATILAPTIEEAVLFGGNTFITPEWVSREALRMLTNQLKFTTYVHRQYAA